MRSSGRDTECKIFVRDLSCVFGLREWRRIEDDEEVVSKDVGVDGGEEKWR